MKSAVNFVKEKWFGLAILLFLFWVITELHQYSILGRGIIEEILGSKITSAEIIFTFLYLILVGIFIYLLIRIFRFKI